MTRLYPRLAGVGKRLDAFIGTWPASLKRDFLAYASEARATEDRIENRPDSLSVGPYWRLLPGWLQERYAPTPSAASAPEGFFADVSWGQYCLFLAIRLQDDLFDGQTEIDSLASVADRLLEEAKTAFSAHFPPASPFWGQFRDALRNTSEAIIEVDQLQREPGGLSEGTVHLYARVCEVLKVGCAAVCIELDRLPTFDTVSRCCDHLAIVGHLCDDFLDIDEDLRRGRYNFAANVLLGGEVPPTTIEAIRAITDRLIRSERSAILFDRIRAELRRATEVLAPLELPSASSYLEVLRESIDRFEAALHRGRVELLFGAIGIDC